MKNLARNWESLFTHPARLRKLHRWSAVLIGAYSLIHIINHLVGLAGANAHLGFMKTLRVIYRFPLVEASLLLAILIQVYTGLVSVFSRWKKRRGVVPWIQALSGLYLAFFFVNHVGAVLYGRSVLQLDTNLYFAAAGFYVSPFGFFFAPYYFLAVWALFTHVGCIVYWLSSVKVRALSLTLISGAGLLISVLIVLMLAGVFYPLNVPVEYKATYGFTP